MNQNQRGLKYGSQGPELKGAGRDPAAFSDLGKPVLIFDSSGNLLPVRPSVLSFLELLFFYVLCHIYIYIYIYTGVWRGCPQSSGLAGLATIWVCSCWRVLLSWWSERETKRKPHFSGSPKERHLFKIRQPRDPSKKPNETQSDSLRIDRTRAARSV